MNLGKSKNENDRIILSKSEFDDLLHRLTPLELQALWESIQDHEHFAELFEQVNVINQRLNEFEVYVNDVQDAYHEILKLYSTLFEEQLTKKTWKK